MKQLVAILVVCAACAKPAPKATLSDRADPACRALEADKIVEVQGDITTDTKWTKDKVYRLEDHIFVQNAVLTIEPGTGTS